MFWIKTCDLKVRTRLIKYLKDYGIAALFHYVPLHSAPAGHKYSRFSGDDQYTTAESERLMRLPMYYALTRNQQDIVIETIKSFFR
jgi:dTDP-4-amino-4,6-dideoxygalactose transaminase